MKLILQEVWDCLVTSSREYVKSVVNGNKENHKELVDAEGTGKKIFFIQILCLKFYLQN